MHGRPNEVETQTQQNQPVGSFLAVAKHFRGEAVMVDVFEIAADFPLIFRAEGGQV
jgi:hypothetical protein